MRQHRNAPDPARASAAARFVRDEGALMHKMQWTEEQWMRAQCLRNEGKNFVQIGAALGMTRRQVKNRFYHKALSREQLDAKNNYERENRYTKKSERKTPYAWPAPEPSVLVERNIRLATPPRDLTAALCGDPRPGWSALERRA
jgi:hypothetical protein